MLYRILFSVSLVMLLGSTAHGQIQRRMKPFLGTWDYENIKGFEVWKMNGKELSGQAFRIKENRDTLLIETMRLAYEDKKLVMYVRVENQNGGKEIRFEESSKLRNKFVNESHDFPKSIYYQFKRFNRKKVQVLLNHPHKDTHTKPITLVRRR